MKSTRVLAAALLMLLSAFLPGPGVAGTQDGAMMVLHVQAHTTKNGAVCTTAAPAVPCSQYRVGWPVSTPADVYLVVVRAKPEPGIAGMSCGIDYDGRPGQGVDVLGYQLCADLEFPSAGLNGEWPADGGGDRITWVSTTNCQRTVIDPDGVHAVACAFYVYAYSPDLFGVTPNWNVAQNGELVVADCSASMTPVYHGTTQECAGVIFGGQGCNPCVYGCWCPEVQPTTWGRVKRSFVD
jgi:hypothetical protein